MRKLSARQQRILRFIQEFLDQQGYPPTIRDIQRGCQVSSTSVVDYNLRVLQQEGYLRRDPEVSRGLQLVDGPRTRGSRSMVPVIGYIAAGAPVPVPTEEQWGRGEALETVEVPSQVAGSAEDLYALRVKGQSMIDALIDDGDVVVVRPPTDVRDGDMVVAWLKLEKEATLKRLYREGHRVRLQPANARMEPIYTDASNVEVQGKVVAVLRTVQ